MTITIMDIIRAKFDKLFFPSTKPTPSEFRRGKTTRRILGISIDRNARHVGRFTGGITPMRRRFKGVSRTARNNG